MTSSSHRTELERAFDEATEVYEAHVTRLLKEVRARRATRSRTERVLRAVAAAPLRWPTAILSRCAAVITLPQWLGRVRHRALSAVEFLDPGETSDLLDAVLRDEAASSALVARALNGTRLLTVERA